MTAPNELLLQKLKDNNQDHLLKWYGELSADQQARLLKQIEAVDPETIQRVWTTATTDTETDDSGKTSRADRAMAPQSVVRQAATTAEQQQREEDARCGAQLLAAGKIAVITVAGGQGTRLGFDRPKGMFPIGPISGASLFQIFAEQIQARMTRHRGVIPWLIMTSAATHDDTVDFFGANNYFGLNRSDVHFFQQGSMPAVDLETGRILMKNKAELCLSPDGHGGLVTALQSSGLLAEMAEHGIEHIFYHQVDNPTVVICDPVLLGVHARLKSQLTTNVVAKRTPAEKMGALAEVDKHLEIIEYSELNEEQAARTDPEGRLVFWAGNTAIHVFARSFLEELAGDGCRLELHVARKAVPHIDEAGELVEPDEPNAGKFERFIFDALPLATNALIVEGDRDREFNPVKNAEGNDSPATARAAITHIGADWLAAAGVNVAPDADVEISPLVALDAEELSQKLAAGTVRVEDLVRHHH